MIDPESVRHERTGDTVLTVRVPPPPEWLGSLDAARERLHHLESELGGWFFVSLSVPSHSYGYICVLEKRGITHSMSGASSLAHVVAGFGSSWEAAIDDAIFLAREHGVEKEEARGYVHAEE